MKRRNVVEEHVAAFYGRVSSEEQAGNASTRGQQAEAEAYCRHAGLDLRYCYFDEAKSGKSLKGRDELQRMLEAARAGKFTHLVVWKLTRLSRNLVDTLRLMKQLDTWRVQFHSISEPNYDTSTPSGRMILNVMATLGEFEREVIADNVRMGMKQRAQEGAWIGTTMLGYRIPREPHDPPEVAKAKRLIPIPEEAAVVRRIFSDFAGGLGLKAIANRLNHAGFRTKRGGYFSSVQVGWILDNPVYRGTVRFRTHDPHVREPVEIVVEGAHEALIDEALWTQVRQLRAQKCHRPRRVSDRDFPLTGLLRCPACGAGMTMARTSNRRKDGTKWVRNYYACGRWKNQGTAACNSNMIHADEAEREVLRRLRRIVTHPTFLRDVVARINTKQREALRPLRQRQAHVEKERKRQTGVRDKYRRAFEADAITAQELGERLAEINAQLVELNQEEAELRSRLDADASVRPIPYEAVKRILDDFATQLSQANGDRRRALLHALIREITFERGKGIQGITLHLHEGITQMLGIPDSSVTTDVILTA